MFSVIKNKILLTKRESRYSSFISQYWPRPGKVLNGIWTSPLTILVLEPNGSISSVRTSLEPGRNFYNAVMAVLEEEGHNPGTLIDEVFQFLRVEERRHTDDCLIVRRKYVMEVAA